MDKLKDDFIKRYETENMQFLFLCGNKDRKILLSQNKPKDIDELVRLACISLIFGYKTVFLKISSINEKQVDEFLKKCGDLDGKFNLFNKWATEFIENIQYPEAQKLARQVWQERKVQLDGKDFTVKLLMDTLR